MVKIRDSGHIHNKAIYLAIGINRDGLKEALGLGVAQTEGAKFWLSVMMELKNRGVQDIFIACVDGLKGFPEAIETVFPKIEVQLCIVHLVRNCLKYVGYKERKAVADDLRKIIKNRGSFPKDEAALKLIYLALENISEKWAMPIREWKAALNRFAIVFGERLPYV